MNIPFVDLSSQYEAIKAEIDKAIADTIAQTAFIKSPSVTNFEKEFGDYLDADQVLACGNGTDALEIAMQVLGIGPGDEVIVPAMTWISTSEIVDTAGATPVFVDVHPDTYTIDPTQIEGKITPKTKAIIPVHLYGNPAVMPKIMNLAAKHDLKVIEDCAQAHGAQIDGKTLGTWGDIATFSFFPTKNLGAYGDAGAMVFKDAELARQARMIANHGQEERHWHELHGRNSRMDGLQAAILSVKLKHLDSWTDLRIAKAGLYTELFAKAKTITSPTTRENAKHVFHLYVIRSKDRNALMEHLKSNGIACSIHYPLSLPFQPCYAHLNLKKEDYPVAARYQDEILSLPLFPELADGDIEKIVDTILKFEDR